MGKRKLLKTRSDLEDACMDGFIKQEENIEHCCDICEHLFKDEVTCRAFPRGIPVEFWTAEERHDKIVKDQKGEFVFKEQKSKQKL